MKKRWNSSKIAVQKYFSTQKMFMIIPKYHGGPMSHCTILDLCHTVRQFQIYFLSFAKVKTRCFLLFGTEKYSTMPIQLESLVYVLFSKSSQAVRSILWFSVQCDTLLENQISEVFLTINERIWTIPSKYVIPNMKPLQYSRFGHKKSFFALKPWITQNPYSVTFMLALF